MKASTKWRERGAQDTRIGVRRGNARGNGLLGVSRGGMEQEMVCGQAVFFTRFSRRACLALYARFMLA